MALFCTESKGPALWMHILVVMRRERVSNDMSEVAKYSRGKTKKYKTRETQGGTTGTGMLGEKEGGDLLPRVRRASGCEEKTHDGEA